MYYLFILFWDNRTSGQTAPFWEHANLNLVLNCNAPVINLHIFLYNESRQGKSISSSTKTGNSLLQSRNKKQIDILCHRLDNSQFLLSLGLKMYQLQAKIIDILIKLFKDKLYTVVWLVKLPFYSIQKIWMLGTYNVLYLLGLNSTVITTQCWNRTGL